MSAAIRYDDRLLLVGTTGCGKSTVARRITESTRPPRQVIDPADSSATKLPGAATIEGLPPHAADRDAAEHLRAQLEAHRDADTLRIVPGDSGRAAEYDALYRWVFDRRYPSWTWLDEAGEAIPAAGAPAYARKLLVQGRKRRLGHLACHTRPREIDRNLIAQAQHVMVWRLPNPDDREVIARQMGTNAGELAQLLEELPAVAGAETATGFLWYQQRPDTITVCPAPDE